MTEKMPDTSQAEKWLDPDTFIYKGKVYKTDGFTIKEISPDAVGKELKPCLIMSIAQK